MATSLLKNKQEGERKTCIGGGGARPRASVRGGLVLPRLLLGAAKGRLLVPLGTTVGVRRVGGGVCVIQGGWISVLLLKGVHTLTESSVRKECQRSLMGQKDIIRTPDIGI